MQHNPLVADGKQVFVDYSGKNLEKNIEFIRAVAESDLVALHTHQIWPGNKHYVAMDFFRFDNTENFLGIVI